MGKHPDPCPNCGGENFAVFGAVKVDAAVGHGQLRASDCTPIVVTGCRDCSETISEESVDEFLQDTGFIVGP